MAFDYGSVRIGVAVGNAVTRSATPLGFVSNRNGTPDWDAIDKWVAQWQPDELVVGMPLTADGDDQAITPHVKGFIKALQRHYGLVVHEEDERFSSVQAQVELAQMRGSGQRKRRVGKGDVDAIAATLILEKWLAEN